MNKNTYETYEYLSVPTNNAEPGTEQLFVVQDDGTFIVNKQVQYVAQVEDGKEVLDSAQSCSVYDVTPQEFYVDVDNSAELISVPDNFILPDGEGNLYANNYLLQTVSNTNTVQLEEDVVDQFNQTDTQEIILVNADSELESSNCTEITLSDEQYHKLEQKGWILLEINDKVFMLDTCGLHDITTNQELIQQLKIESECYTNLQIDSSTPKNACTIKLGEVTAENTSSEQNTIEFTIDNDKTEDNTSDTFMVDIKQEGSSTIEDVTEKEQHLKVKDIERVNKVETQIHKEGSTVQIKTNLIFRDIPNKIVLGKTLSGKKLVAKVMKVNKPLTKDNEPVGNSGEAAQLITEAEDTQSLEWQFQKIMWRIIHTDVKCDAEHLVAASDVIKQLLQLPAFKLAVLERNLLITKLVKHKDKDVQIEGITSVVTGRVTKTQSGRKQFVHMPNILKNIKAESVESGTDGSSLESQSRNPSEDNSILHIHIMETKCKDSPECISITLKKRQLPLIATRDSPFPRRQGLYQSEKELTEQQENQSQKSSLLSHNLVTNTSLLTKRRQAKKVYACSSCATIFHTEKDLMDHQENQCIEPEPEGTLTIDTDQIPVKFNPYYVLKTDNGTQYICIQCSLKFNKLSNCQRHCKTHFAPSKPEASFQKHKSEETATYKCKMCSSSYFHPSTLSKHIVTAHIKVSTN